MHPVGATIAMIHIEGWGRLRLALIEINAGLVIC
jgi:hypothetical protein